MDPFFIAGIASGSVMGLLGLVLVLLCLYICLYSCYKSCLRSKSRSNDLEKGQIQGQTGSQTQRLEGISEVIYSIDELEAQVKACQGYSFKELNDVINDLEVKSVLKVTSVLKVKTPPALYNRHVYKGQLQGQLNKCQAEKLSEGRGGYFKRKSDKNTVFEDPKYFNKCIVDFDKFGTTRKVLIASVPVSTFQCQQNKDGKWEASDLGLRWPVFELKKRGPHFLSKSLDYDQVDFL
jgi:hypothetical protein